MLRTVDDFVFSIEQSIVAAFLAAITVMVFLDVVYRRLIVSETKLGNWLIDLLSISDDAGIERMHGVVAPAIYALIALLGLWFCVQAAERERKQPLLPIPQSALVIALGLFFAGVGLLWMMTHQSSRSVYILLFGLFAAGYGKSLWTEKAPQWVIKLALLAITTLSFVWFALRYFPEGYAWSKEVSLLLLLWVGFLGASVCVHEGKHLIVEAVIAKLPPKMGRIAISIGFLSAATFCGFMTLLGYRYVFHPEYGAMKIGGIFEQTGIPDWLSAVAIPVAFGIASLRFLAASVSHLRGGDYGALAKAEGLSEAEKLAAGEAA